MKSRIWVVGVGLSFVLGGWAPAWAANYYVDDGSNDGDVWTPTAYGLDINNGLTPATPKATLANLIGTVALAAGDVVYLDTGTYAPTVISNTVNGTAGSPITFLGSTNQAAGGTRFSGSGYIITIRGKHLAIQDVWAVGGQAGMVLEGASHCEFNRINAVSNSSWSFRLVGGSYSNAFRRCVMLSFDSSIAANPPGAGNYIENSIGNAPNGTFSMENGLFSNVVGCIAIGKYGMYSGRFMGDAGQRNIFFTQSGIGTHVETVADLQRLYPSWTGNTFADPKFLNANGLDFHLLSAAGFVSNGTWTVDPAVGYSPAIDFGAAGAAVGAEPDPNGGRVNVGLHGGTAEASKSRTNAWTFAMSFNDGGNLVQTGRLEWVASTNLAAANVALEYSTNRWTTTNAIATVPATDEAYLWTPGFSHPAVQWRVRDPVSGFASTNAKPFSVRATTNATFSFYVNDGSSANDVYCSGLGNDANPGIATNAPKRSLQAVLDAYDLEGGDVVYVDTGDYATNVSTVATAFDSGAAGRPVRIVGSPNGSKLSRGSTSAHTLELAGVFSWELENLRLADGNRGLFGNGSSNVVLRNVWLTDNQYGAFLAGTADGHRFERCVALNNAVQALNVDAPSTTFRSNRWESGVLWGSPTLVQARTNTLAVSNSILGNGTWLLGSQIFPAGYNVVWDVAPKSDVASFTALQDLGWGWSNCLYADPRFADVAGGDFHLRSTAGRYDTNLADFVATDTNDSPAIDFGDPAAAVSNEPSPNGGRLNAGLFGGTAQASKSRTNAWIQLASYLDGGTLDAQAGAWVRWNAGPYEPGAQVTIWLSRNGGETWTAIATNVPAADGHYFYQVPVPDNSSSREALLRVELDGAAEPSTSPTNFTYRNGTFAFYVNDDSDAGDVYCSALGSDDNAGSSADSPMRSLHALLAKLEQLGPGDRIYVDTGVYPATNAVVLTTAFSGSPTNPVVIAGSTNLAEGGSLFRGTLTPLSLGFDFRSSASNVVLRDVALSNVVRGVALAGSAGVTLDGVEVRGASSRAFDLLDFARSNELVRCVAHGGNVGLYLTQVTNLAVRHCVFWENAGSGVYVGNSVGALLENNVLASTATNAVLVSIPGPAGLAMDYNGLHVGPLARVGEHRGSGAKADNLAAWQRLSGLDFHGIPGDPRLADPANYDYHLKTEETLGRRLPNGQRTTDAVSSPLLDAGNPASTAWTNEPSPNGGRVNVGRHGGTWAASVAYSQPWLRTVAYGDAGGVSNGTVSLTWTAGGGLTTQTVVVGVSTDGGKTWTNQVAAGVPATNGAVDWTVADLPDTPAALWRVTCESDTNVWSQTTNFFAIRNGPLNLYVATPDTNEAVYVAGPGKADNWTATSNAPLNSLRTAFERFDLEPGDQIWVDPGTYEETDAIRITLKDSGTSNQPVRVTGDTNRPYAGTVFKRATRAPGAYGFHLLQADGVRFDSFMVSNAYTAIQIDNGGDVALERVRAGFCVTNAVYAAGNTRVELSRSILEQSLFNGLQASTGAVVRAVNSLMRDNGLANVNVRGGSVDVFNGILEAAGSQRYVYYLEGTGSRLASDYNNVRATGGANVGGGAGRAPERFLIDWQIGTAFSNDVNSFGYDADFADAPALDFHLRSEYGRYDPAVRAFVTNDAATSRLIDMGVPPPQAYSAFGLEPVPNGDRINVGLYGNTAEASKSSGAPSLIPLTMSDGGTIRGNASLFWSWNGFDGNEYVNLWFSWNNGETWTNVATHVYISVGSSTGVLWRTTNFISTAQGVWRVELETDTNVFGQTEIPFAVKNMPLSYYVNDASTNGDVYCSAVGWATNSGLSAEAPLDSLATLMGRYKVEHGDTVFIDTGVYELSAPLAIQVPAAATNFLVIQGSSNEAAGGSVITNSGSGAVLDLQYSRGVELRDLRFHGGGTGLLLTESSSNRFLRVRSVGARGNGFELGERSDQNRFIQCAALNFSRTGFYVAPPSIPAIPATTNFWDHGVLASVPASTNGTAVSTGALLAIRSGRVYASNSVFVAAGPAHGIFDVAPTAFRGDYNAYHRPQSNLFARIANSGILFGVQEIAIDNLRAWRAANPSDANSLEADPRFADLAGGDLHPRSAGGRYAPAADEFVLDEDTSPLIDAADPAAPRDQESAPSGDRANLGVYGNTPHASRTPADGSFVLLDYGQGGNASGIAPLRWIPRGAAFTTAIYNVFVKISTDGGENWQTVSTNPALAGAYAWDTAAFPSVPTVRWQVQCAENLGWASTSEWNFAVHNAGVVYYVNDGATNDGVFTTAAGADGNSGTAPDAPLPSLGAVLARYDLEPGDEVRIDTGQYEEPASTAIGYLDSGTATNPVVIRGSPHAAGTRFASGLRLDNARGVRLEKLRFQAPATDGLAIRASEDVLADEVDVWRAGTGVAIQISSNVCLRHFTVAFSRTNGVTSEASYDTRLEFGTLWSNAAAQVVTRNIPINGGSTNYNVSSVSVSNCILGAYGVRVPAYELRGNLRANHNNLFLRNGALAALERTGSFWREYDSVGAWARSEWAQDGWSLSHDPMFASAANGNFHLQSSAGRWLAETGSWTNDVATSPLIDAGDPLADFAAEVPPNGGRANLGRYGNTAEASRTPTNGALTLVSFNDGGRASGTNVLIQWNARGAITNGGTVSIWYSADGGNNWMLLTNGVAAADNVWIWDSTLSAQSVQALLRIVGSDGSTAQSAAFFAVRNAPFTFYVNDGSQNNDVYCDAIGNNANSGLSPLAPMADLNALLARYDLEGGDVVYIDTGIYMPGVPWRISQADSAGTLATNPVVFQGSTYSLVNGTVLNRNFQSGAIGIQADYAIGIQVRNIVVSNALGAGVAFNNCQGASAEWVAVGLGNVAFLLNGGSHLGVSNCVAYSVTTGVSVANWDFATNTVFPVIQHNVFRETAGTTVLISGQNHATVRNNVLSSAAGEYVYGLGVGCTLDADYNSISPVPGGRVFRQEQERSQSPVPIIYETVGAWALVSSNDLHSYDGDPLLVDATNHVYQLRSRAGRWVSGTNWVQDDVTSPLVDSGDPASLAWANEPADNGQRVNVGLYGGTPRASKTDTNSALHLLTLNRGGVASNQVALTWRAVGAATGRTVRLEVSLDDGATWPVLVATGIPAELGGVIWNSSGLSSPLARWRVVDEAEPAVAATSELAFVLKNGPIHYYVNDESPSHDVYTDAPGNSANSGISRTYPKRWISEILETYNLEPGDVIYVDTGLYQASGPTVIGDLDAGDPAQDPARQVNVVGSTNALAGGSRYRLAGSVNAGFHLDGTHGIRFQHLNVSGPSNGLYVDESYFIGTDQVNVQGCFNGVSAVGASSNLNLSHSVFAENENAAIAFNCELYGAVDVGSCVLWSNVYGIYLENGFVRTSNNVFGMVRPRSYGMYVRADAPIMGFQGDYNCLYVAQPNSAAGALQTGILSTARTSVYATVSAWAAATGQELRSLAQDPLLVDPGNDDFHPRSRGGRYVPGSGWTIDTASSPLIDAGRPESTAWTAEPDPNGRRLNIGRYGGTAEASKTPLAGWITMISLVDGGTAAGLVDLQWTVGGAATNYSVCIKYSPDKGDTWTNVVCGWPAATGAGGAGSYAWDSVPYGRSALGLWQIYCVEDAAIIATSIAPFTLRNGGTIPYYVNDAATNGDVYCSVAGDDANDGLTTNTPKATVQAILETYELAAEDVVYVDAGTYAAGAPPVAIDGYDSGKVEDGTNKYVTIQGSTNPLARTVFQSPSISTPYVFDLNYAVNVRLKDLTIRGAQIGVRSYQTIGCVYDGLRIENNRAAGMNLSFSQDSKLVRSVLWQNNSSATSGVAVALDNSFIAIENSVIWDSPFGVSLESSSLSVTNSVLEANGINGRIYYFSFSAAAASNFRGDYNSYVRRNGALLAEQASTVGGNDFYSSLPSWSALNGSDRHSLTLDPQFANAVNGDFHPQSQTGRFVAATGSWTNDMTNSPLLDAGPLDWPVGAEPAPNGGVVNVGAYGGTAQASMSPTNPWLRAVSYNDEGVLSGTVLLYWLHGGLPPDAKVRLEYSTDYLLTWNPIATNVSAAAREYAWEVCSLPMSLGLNWRVVYESNTNVWDDSDAPVVLKCGTYEYYVNDASTNNDVYCSGPGRTVAAGANPTNKLTPISSLTELFSVYPVGAGDRVYVDTGTYALPPGTPVTIRDRNTGTAEAALLIQGSTNYAAGGSLLLGSPSANGFHLLNTRNVVLRDLRVAQAVNGVMLQNASGITMEGLELFNNATNGVSVTKSSGVQFRNGRVWGNRNYGYYSEGLGGDQILNSTFWGNAQGAVCARRFVAVSNSILCMTNARPPYVELGPEAAIAGDYNLFESVPGAGIATNTSKGVAYGNLSQWQSKDVDLRSFVGVPLFVDPTNGNFHLQSRAGYWSNGAWTAATQTSWAVDAGDPGVDATNEPAPNGGRLNLGAYGNTGQASLSDTNHPGLFPTTLRDGGTSYNGIELYWLYRGLSPTNAVRIEYSPDNGATWLLAAPTADGLPVGSLPYAWNSTAEPSPEALWRIVLLSNTNIWGATPVPFTFRPRPLVYYVNDDSDAGDIYTKALGASTNSGYSSNSPLHSIQAVLDAYPLAPGDEIRVDTGLYSLAGAVRLTVLHSGDETNAVAIRGSTNAAYGGTTLVPDAAWPGAAFRFSGVNNLRVSDFHVAGFSNGVVFADSAARCTLADVDVHLSTNVGVLVDQAREIRLERVLVREGATNGISLLEGQPIALEGCVVWSNRGSAIFFGEGVTAEITNSVLEASGPGRYCYESSSNLTLRADYNDLVLSATAQVAKINGIEYPSVPQWVKSVKQDLYSLNVDPLFHDPANGDFHLRSAAGRYQPGVGWVQDAATGNHTNDFSPLIDMGKPQMAWSNEPAPRGNRRNIGLYGNTAQASMSDTNRWLQCVTAKSGGILFEDVDLVWGYGGDIDSNDTVQLEYSARNGEPPWIAIGDEVAVGLGKYPWDSDWSLFGADVYRSSSRARWRITLLKDPAVQDEAGPFGLRNKPFKYYVNDAETNNDVFCTAPGSDDNYGDDVDIPKLTLQELLGRIDVEPADQVFIDTGVYLLTDTNQPVVWGSGDAGLPGLPVQIFGSPHADGTRFVAPGDFVPQGQDRGMWFVNADDLDMRDLRFAGESLIFNGKGLVVSNLVLTNRAGAQNVALWLRSESSRFQALDFSRAALSLSGLSNRVEGLRQRWAETAVYGTNVALLNSAVFTTNAGRTGIVVNAAYTVISNCAVLSTRGSAVGKLGAYPLRLGHSILVAGSGDGNAAIAWEDGDLVSDWNNLLARGSAWIGVRKGKWEKLAYWQAASGQDANSVSFEPAFADETRGDLHLKSQGGRWSQYFFDLGMDPWDYGDTETSPLIDLGNTAIGARAEAALPWAYRLNLGAYGGTVQASKSLTNFWLTALSHNDGGVVKGTNVVLRWRAANVSTQSVALQYSLDGTNWLVVATGQDPNSGYYVWDTTGLDGFAVWWRVVAEDGSGVADATDAPFAVRNAAQAFYVNDALDPDDVYCTAPGSSANDGLAPGTPKATLQQVLDQYDLEGGDVVYLDTGTYAASADIRVIWSRSGSTNADVVVQGNSNSPYATVLQRSGPTNFPGIGIDVKASYFQLRDLNVRGIDRTVRLESNVNARVRGVVFSDAATGLDVQGALGTEVRNSGFWKTGIGINLANTRTSVMENLTFARSTLAGIQMQNTAADTLQNNVFIPDVEAYAYAIGGATSLLAEANMDYNLYDFRALGSGFYAGSTNDYPVPDVDPLRPWHLGMKRDYRSYVGPAQLADPEFTGDFHPQSSNGRWVATSTGGSWTFVDTNVSWAVDRGNPASDFSREPAVAGGRINLGMYGNTEQASQGDTNAYFEIRSLDAEGIVLEGVDLSWPMIWSAHMIDGAEWVQVEFSGDGGTNWTPLAVVPAYQEYYLWTAGLTEQTDNGFWRVVGTNQSATSQHGFDFIPIEFRIRRSPYPVSGLMRFDWQGGLPGKRYVIRFSDDFGQSWSNWPAKYNGPAPVNMSDFVLATTSTNYVFEDRTSYLKRQRWYRIDPVEEAEEEP
jgi:hypothetical protein